MSIQTCMIEPIVIVIGREEVEAQDTSGSLSLLQGFLATPETAKNHFEKVDIAFHGYEAQTSELWEIPAVRNFVFKLDDAFPYWAYFLSKSHPGLQALILCFLPPFLTEDAKAQIFSERLRPLLLDRWFPAMNQICTYVGMTDDEIERLTNRVISYIKKGRLPDVEGIDVTTINLNSN
jgi:hypothetical protein